MMPATKAARRVRSGIVRGSGQTSVERPLEEGPHRTDARRQRQFLATDDEDRDAIEVAVLERGVGGDVHLAHEGAHTARPGPLLEKRLEVGPREVAEAAAVAGVAAQLAPPPRVVCASANVSWLL